MGSSLTDEEDQESERERGMGFDLASASSSQIFYDPTCMAHVWNRQHQVMVYYDAEGRPVGETMREMPSFFGVLMRWSDIISVEPRDWHLMDAAIKNWVWEEIWRRYGFFYHKRARDARLRKIGELYWVYKVKLYRGWLEHQRDTPEEFVS
ncbi:hypothetical protein COCNU_scaffold001528G000010 [Cocos nucifera]|nr:hypothetical protein [Cocos nucifera]